MTDDPTFRRQGHDGGSGPTESGCGAVTRRLKGPGMRWEKDDAEAAMAPAAIHHGNLRKVDWQTEKQAA